MGRLAIEKIAPERGGNGPSAAPAGHCCCCCCCCLHSVGGVVGALIATPAKVPFGYEPVIPPATVTGGTNLTPKYSAAGLYWACTFIVAAVATSWFLFAEHQEMSSEVAFWSAALFLPFYQLGGGVVAILALLPSKRLGRELRMQHLGRITLFGFLGAIVGFGVMVVMFVLLSNTSRW